MFSNYPMYGVLAGAFL